MNSLVDAVGKLSLGQAIQEANANPGADIINFDPGLKGTIPLSSGQLTITDDLTIDGPGASVIAVSGNNTSRVFAVDVGETVKISGLTITEGSAHTSLSDSGSGIANSGTLTLNNVVISGNLPSGSGVAGGIYNGGTLTLNNSTVSGNDGGGAAGGIENDGVLTLNNSTVSSNRVGWTGGGILNTGVLTLNNSTVSGNTADAWGDGGGLWNADTGTLTLNNSTVSGNSALMGGVGGGIFNKGRATLNNTIVANSPSGGDVFNTGTLTGSYNLIEDGSGGLADTIVADPKLGPLKNNGGPTQTMALLPDSPAINAGDPNIPNPPPYDQRGSGFPRIVGGRIDIGAYELQSQQSQTATVLTVASASGTYDGTTTLTATLTAGGEGVAGQSVAFTLNDKSVGSVTTSSTGVATLNNVSLAGLNAGTYGIQASFTGDINYAASRGTNTLTVTQAATVLTVASASGTYGGTTTLTATLTGGVDSTPLSGRRVTFTLNGQPFENNWATTNSSGAATLRKVSLAGINAGTYATGIGASFAGDTNYLFSNGTGTLTVTRRGKG